MTKHLDRPPHVDALIIHHVDTPNRFSDKQIIAVGLAVVASLLFPVNTITSEPEQVSLVRVDGSVEQAQSLWK